MTPHPLAHPGRIAWIATLLLILACSPAFAVAAAQDTVPPPPPAPDSLLYIRDVIVGRVECPVCPPRVCPDQPVLVTVRGQFPNACYRLRSLSVAPNRGLFPMVVADVVFVGCSNDCSILPVGFEASVELPSEVPGDHQFALREQARLCPDTTVVSSNLGRLVTYNVLPDCGTPPPPIPPDSLVRTFVRLAISPEHPCAGDSVTLQLLTNGCPPCVHLKSFGTIDADTGSYVGVIEWTPQCLNIRCAPESLAASLGRLAQGSFHVIAPMIVHVLGTPNPDSTIMFVLPFAFQVGPPGCVTSPGPCVVREMESDVPSAQCALTLPRGGSGDVPLYYSSALAMAGVQGVINVPPPFVLDDLRVASGLTGVHLSRQRTVGGWRWLVFTDPGVTLAPGVHQHLLDATIKAYSYLAPSGSSALMTVNITLAAGAGGEALPLCNRETFAIVAVRLCMAGETNACDVNHDGQLDVRDLVRMSSCLQHDLVDTTGACVDCDSSGVFNLNDIYCCAVAILRGPPVPPDSVHQDGSVSVSYGPVWASGNSRIVHVHVSGANALGATMLQLDYPADRWQAYIPIVLDATTRPVDADWYPLIDLDDPGHVHLGGIRVGDSGANEFDVEFWMSSIAPALPGDQLVVVGADLAGRDGRVLTPRDPLPALSLTAPAPPRPGPGPPPPTTLALSAARPNPFTTSTSFEVDLPNSAPIDLAVHDLAGRRVATIASGVYPAGRRVFDWDGAGMRGGIYYVRLRVNGQVLSTRVALLKNAH
ncbi:MAG TPA: T9SS type A sorting domain-containing protein [Verrucomicrobiae bacterium]|nr:T9SS type A sorting domain-containing protein [Verrucomicrobiae bacterium]